MTYQNTITQMRDVVTGNGPSWAAIDPESAARMAIQNRFRTGLDIAQYTAKIMRADMAVYDANPAQYTQSLGCWHGFIAQQKLIAIKKHFGTTKQRYLYLSGWMVAALRSEFGPLPDQSMHEKTSVPALIEELYTFLKQADARELGMMFRALDAAREAGDATCRMSVMLECKASLSWAKALCFKYGPGPHTSLETIHFTRCATFSVLLLLTWAWSTTKQLSA
jgi:isocitrate lyase